MADTIKMIALDKLRESKNIFDSIDDSIDRYLLSSIVNGTIKKIEKYIVQSEIDKMTSTNKLDDLT